MNVCYSLPILILLYLPKDDIVSKLSHPSVIYTMLQEQYLFLHAVLLEAFETEDFTCQPPTLHQKLSSHVNNHKQDTISLEHMVCHLLCYYITANGKMLHGSILLLIYMYNKTFS